MECRNCGNEVHGVPGRRPREFCSNACRQADYRRRHNPAREMNALVAELAQARQRNAELEAQVAQLQVELQWLEDSSPREFKAWLARLPSPSRFVRKLLDPRSSLPRQGPRHVYETYLRRTRAPADELAEFTRLWRQMLSEQS